MGADPVSLAIMTGTQIASGVAGRPGARKAQRAEQAGREAAIGTAFDARDYFQSIQTPFLEAGQQALNPLTQAVLGTDNYRDPMLDQVQDQVARRVMQNQALQGRFTSGDMPGLLATALIDPAIQLRQQRISNLGGLAQMGMNAGSQLGNNAMQVAGIVGGQQVGIGQSQANAEIARTQALQNMFSSVGSAVLNAFSGGAAPSTGFQFTNPLATSNSYAMSTPSASGISNYLLPRA